MINATIVVPTIGRRSLDPLLKSLAAQARRPQAVVLVDDRRVPDPPLTVPDELASYTTIVHSGGRGPAAARNVGWRAATTPWVVFLDDDVIPLPSWSERLVADLTLPTEIAGTQAVIVVPRPDDRRLTDQERNVAALEEAELITADLAVRRDALILLHGFDERFPRAYREDSDFVLRGQVAGLRLTMGSRTTYHPLRTGPWWVSVTAQRGNRDDALMRAIHGRRWSTRRGRRRRHVAIVAAAAGALSAAVTGHRRAAAACGLMYIAGTAELAAARILAGPQTRREVAAMFVTSIGIPPAATWWWLTGLVRWRARSTHPWSWRPEPHRSGSVTPELSEEERVDRVGRGTKRERSPVP